MLVVIVVLLIVAVLGWSEGRGRFDLRIARCLLHRSARGCGSDGRTGASVMAGGAWS
jgi:hypothetical protein